MRLFLLTAFFSFYSVMGFAAEEQNLVELLNKLNTFEGRFEQTVQDKNGEVIQENKGTFAIKRPGFFKWESEEPYPQLIIGNPERLWLYDPDLEQVNVRKQVKDQLSTPSQLLSGDVAKMAEAYNISEESNKKQSVFILTPKDSESPYASLSFVFKKGVPEKFSFKDRLEQSTEIVFAKTSVNKTIADDVFEFIAPEGTDIIYDE